MGCRCIWSILPTPQEHGTIKERENSMDRGWVVIMGGGLEG